MSYVCASDDLRDPRGLMMGVSRGEAAFEGSSSGAGDDLMQAFNLAQMLSEEEEVTGEKVLEILGDQGL